VRGSGTVSIRAIRLREFRGFRNATINLKPLTVLLGPNSAGKSAWGHALAAIAHAHSLYPSGDRLTLSPDPKEADEWPIDLGLLSDLRNNAATDRVLIGAQTAEGWVEFGFGLPGFFEESLRVSSLEYPQGPQESGVVPLRIQPANVPPDQSVSVSTSVTSLGSSTGSGLRLHRINEVEWRDLASGELITLDLKGLELLSVKHRPGGTSIIVNNAAQREVRQLLDGLTYLRASRQRPLRSYRTSEVTRQEIGYAGERIAAVLNKRGPDNIEWREPPRIAERPEDVQLDASWTRREGPLLNAVGWWLEHLGLARSVQTIKSPRQEDELEIRASLDGQQSHDLTEIGFGISQVVPVITAGLLESQDGLFVVDLPEAHLHPRPQAELADFFCSLALSGRSTLVETHSEMFFHRLRLRAEMNPSLREQIAVYFIDPPVEGCCSSPREVGLKFDDELKWPAGFLQEGWETETQIRVVRQSKQKAGREGAS
jgi:predicted ATPase